MDLYTLLALDPLSTLRYLTLSATHGRYLRVTRLNFDEGFRGSLYSVSLTLLSTLRYLTLFAAHGRYVSD